MIVNVRGTGGSGKTTLVRSVMSRYDTVTGVNVPGRKQPIMYKCEHIDDRVRDLVVIGHYESPCGGCDTINRVVEVFGMAEEYASKGYNVLFEGLFVSGDVNRTAELAKTHEVNVIVLDVPLGECVESINTRRRRKKPEAEDVNPTNTVSKYHCVTRSMERLLALNVSCHLKNRSGAMELIGEFFGFNKTGNVSDVNLDH